MIFETYSQRQQASSATPDVYQYDDVPAKLRVQVQQILRDAIGPHIRLNSYVGHTPEHNPVAWQFIHKTLCREFGVHSLVGALTEGEEVISFLTSCSTTDFVDAVEVCVRAIDGPIRDWHESRRKSRGIKQEPDDAINEINYRFRKCGLGFQFVEGQAVRVDSEFLHQEVVKPALRILNGAQFEGARDEFLSAHRHYRNGDYEEAITEAAKSFESTMKAICDQMGWTYLKGARASDLVKVLRAHHLWPDYLDRSFEQLIATLSSGLPKVRDDSGAHGQGTAKRETPGYIAAYALHLAASKIVLMAEASAALTDARADIELEETV